MSGIGMSHLRDRDDLLLRVEHLSVAFSVGRRQTLSAVSDVSFDLARGETLGVVGESGCGKSTVAFSVMGLETGRGRVEFDGVDLNHLSGRAARRARVAMKLIFQDPLSALNPRRRIADIVAEPFEIWGRPDDAQARLDEALSAVGLDPDVVGQRRPHQFSGGQCQRICIARALVSRPQLLICDEAVSALDVSVQAQILNLLEDLKTRFGLTMIFISHDLAVVRNISDRVAVMYLGRLCEIADADDLYTRAAHPYSLALLAAGTESKRAAHAVVADASSDADDTPSAINPPSGCRYRTICPRADARCVGEVPEMREIRTGHFVACHHPVD